MGNHQQAAYPLRLPEDVREWLKERAKQELRSVNGVITILLTKAMKESQNAKA